MENLLHFFFFIPLLKFYPVITTWFFFINWSLFFFLEEKYYIIVKGFTVHLHTLLITGLNQSDKVFECKMYLLQLQIFVIYSNLLQVDLHKTFLITKDRRRIFG
jgi:hypothetical protein